MLLRTSTRLVPCPLDSRCSAATTRVPARRRDQRPGTRDRRLDGWRPRAQDVDDPATSDLPPPTEDPGDDGLPSWLFTSGSLLAWAVFVGYGLILSPNQTPDRDLYFVERLFSLVPEDGFHINTVFSGVFYLLGIVPLIYGPLVIPSARSKNKIPAWPFLVAMAALGNYAFLPYTALWQPDPTVVSPPAKRDLEGWSKVGLRVFESALFPVLLFFPVSWSLLQMIICGGAEWQAFLKYYDESRLVHNSTIDFCSLVLLLPFWMSHDAAARGWKSKDQLLPILSCLLLLGPIVYLILRPKAK